MVQTICTNSFLKQNTTLHYEKAIYFDNAYFSQQGTSTETWENVFDDKLTAKKRLDGSILNLSTIDWHYNSNNSSMDVSGNYNGIQSKITPQPCSTCAAIASCDALPLRMKEAENFMLIQSNFDFELYPNPSSEKVSVKMEEGSSPFAIKIADASGRILLNSDYISRNTEIDISSLSNGLYLISITQQGIVKGKPLIINR